VAADDRSDDRERSERLSKLDRRIAALKQDRAPAPRKPAGDKYAGAALAWRLLFELAAGIVVGFGMGYGLDVLFGTLPVFLILFTLLGFGAGIRVMIQSAGAEQQRLSGVSPPGEEKIAPRREDGPDGAREREGRPRGD